MIEGTVRAIFPGRVSVDAGGVEVEAGIRGALKGGARTAAHVVAVGDRVRISRSERDASCEEVLPRKNRVSRADPGDPRRELVLAANLDQLLVVVSWDRPALNLRGLDRLLVLGEMAGIPPLIVLNKVDLMQVWKRGRPPARLDPGADPDPLSTYRKLGYPVFAVSARTRAGCDVLAPVLAGRITLLAGPSGAGKSTLLNALVPQLALRTGSISRATRKGVHTTTRVEWIPFEGGAILDSPGLRSIQPWGLTSENLAAQFREFRELPGCRFGDCRHRGEPGCAIQEALEQGIVDPARYDSYRRMLEAL